MQRCRLKHPIDASLLFAIAMWTWAWKGSNRKPESTPIEGGGGRGWLGGGALQSINRSSSRCQRSDKMMLPYLSSPLHPVAFH